MRSGLLGGGDAHADHVGLNAIPAFALAVPSATLAPMPTQEITTTQPGRIASDGRGPSSIWIPGGPRFLAKSKNAAAKRAFRDRRQPTDADLAVRLTTMENNA